MKRGLEARATERAPCGDACAATDQPVSAYELRAVMGRFATGVAIITVECQGKPHGMTVNSLTSVSLAPPLLLVCMNRGTRTIESIKARGMFVVNILGDTQDDLSNHFARPTGEDRFAGIEMRTNRHGLPEVPANCHLSCRVQAIHDGGDHEIVLGEVIETRVRERRPLIFYRGMYDTLTGQGRGADWYW